MDMAPDSPQKERARKDYSHSYKSPGQSKKEVCVHTQSEWIE